MSCFGSAVSRAAPGGGVGWWELISAKEGPRSSRIRGGVPAPATVLGFWEGDSCRDGTVLWIGLAGREDRPCTDGSPMSPLGACRSSPLISMYGHALWRCRFWFLLCLGDGWAGRRFDASHLKAPVSWLAPALTLLQKCQGQIRRGSIELVWMGSTNSRFGMSQPKRGERIKDGCIHLEEASNSCVQNMLRVKPNAFFLVCTGVALAYCSCAADRQDKEAYRSWGGGSTVSAR